MRVLALFLLMTTAVPAADYAIVVNDAEKKALIDLLDAAVRANGLSVASAAAYLAQKINAAGVVTETKESPKQESPQ